MQINSNSWRSLLILCLYKTNHISSFDNVCANNVISECIASLSVHFLLQLVSFFVFKIVLAISVSVQNHVFLIVILFFRLRHDVYSAVPDFYLFFYLYEFYPTLFMFLGSLLGPFSSFVFYYMSSTKFVLEMKHFLLCTKT